MIAIGKNPSSRNSLILRLPLRFESGLPSLPKIKETCPYCGGTPPFMFCNAIDDACMQVTHALRGEDHLTNTPKQLLILRALGLVPPQYGHVSLILGRDGRPLSKRNGSRSIKELREEGFLPIAIINYLSRLGHYYENPHFMAWSVLVEHFSLSALSVSPARFDPDH